MAGGSSSGGAGRTPGTDAGTLPMPLPEASGICVPHQPGPDQIYLFFFSLKGAGLPEVSGSESR